MDFALFVLLNAVLLIRPEELMPDIAGLRLYLIVISLNILVAGPRLADTLRPAELVKRPITVCVLGLWFAGILSQMVRGQIGLAVEFAADFGKVMLYYLLLVSIIDTPGRLRAFLGWIVVCVVILSTLGQLQYYDVIDIEAMRLSSRIDYIDAESGEAKLVLQLCATGIYNDPNDLCLILVTGSLCALYRSTTAASIFARVLWLLPIGLFGYSLILTRSRGGLLGLMAAMATWAYGRFGWKKTLPLCLLMLPGMMLLSGGRQTEIKLGEDTAHQRVQLWSEGFAAMMQNPITGIGVGEYAEVAGLVAHNSFVHAYVETGVLGGGLFLGAFIIGVLALLGACDSSDRIRVFVLAIMVGYAGGIFSLSRNYVGPTYMILGLAQTCLTLTFQSPPAWLRVGETIFCRLLIGVGIFGFLALKLVTRGLLSLAG